MKPSVPLISGRLLVIMLCLITVWPVFAQRPRPHRQLPAKAGDKVGALQVAFLTRELNLTEDEAKVFWPVYNEFKEKRKTLSKQFREKYGEKEQSPDKLSEAQCKEIVDNQIVQEQRMLDLKKEYHSRFLAVLPAAKVLALYEAEKKFRKVLLERLKERGPQRDRPPMRPPPEETPDEGDF
ncbi:MAG TPA: hypothetical protein P5531_07210 [Bacteroidales bacterium]|nr:hypothetical protein [Bacteroidales bacterium]HSA43327.1 hypothetical protein [Bacteroidales bacterium]